MVQTWEGQRKKQVCRAKKKKMESSVWARLSLKYLADTKAEIPRYMTLEFLGDVGSRDKDLRVLNTWNLWL